MSPRVSLQATGPSIRPLEIAIIDDSGWATQDLRYLYQHLHILGMLGYTRTRDAGVILAQDVVLQGPRAQEIFLSRNYKTTSTPFRQLSKKESSAKSCSPVVNEAEFERENGKFGGRRAVVWRLKPRHSTLRRAQSSGC
jgi:hypothetical protein